VLPIFVCDGSWTHVVEGEFPLPPSRTCTPPGGNVSSEVASTSYAFFVHTCIKEASPAEQPFEVYLPSPHVFATPAAASGIKQLTNATVMMTDSMIALLHVVKISATKNCSDRKLR
jgi:hypothetical protein